MDDDDDDKCESVCVRGGGGPAFSLLVDGDLNTLCLLLSLQVGADRAKKKKKKKKKKKEQTAAHHAGGQDPALGCRERAGDQQQQRGQAVSKHAGAEQIRAAIQSKRERERESESV